MEVTHAQVVAWRLRLQRLVPRTDAPVEELVARMAGVQAQVGSAAELALAVRQKTPRAVAMPSALAARALVRTWAMRGTLHLLPAEGVAAYLALLGGGAYMGKALPGSGRSVDSGPMAALGGGRGRHPGRSGAEPVGADRGGVGARRSGGAGRAAVLRVGARPQAARLDGAAVPGAAPRAARDLHLAAVLGARVGWGAGPGGGRAGCDFRLSGGT
ncbi:DNA glycosylase AlkZ-like family protein [Streptomyces nigrescens]